MDKEKLIELFKKTTFHKDKKFDWEGLKIDSDLIYVPQGSHLGETLIMFDDNYEGSGEDALFISEVLKAFEKDVKK